jgi:hypothetical protein
MITHDLATAKILFILASDSSSELIGITRDLQRSRYRYFFAHYADKSALVESVRQRIADNNGRLPTVLLINDKFAGKECITLLELARDVRKSAAIECVVTHPPARENSRKVLLALGARLFNGEDGMAIAEQMLH